MKLFFTSIYQSINDHSEQIEGAAACAATFFISLKLQQYGIEEYNQTISLSLSEVMCVTTCILKNFVWKEEWTKKYFLQSINPSEIAAVTYGVLSEWPLMKGYSFFSGHAPEETTAFEDQMSDLPEYRH